MSKGLSGLFSNTQGFENWNTSVVWKHIESTQNAYENTELPSSFNIKVNKTTFWVHPNATKHIHENILSFKKNFKNFGQDTKLYTQFVLYDYWKTLCKLSKDDIIYNKVISRGNWEFVFAKPKSSDKNPVIKHALFYGINRRNRDDF